MAQIQPDWKPTKPLFEEGICIGIFATMILSNYSASFSMLMGFGGLLIAHLIMKLI